MGFIITRKSIGIVLLVVLVNIATFGQTRISGKVSEGATNAPLAGVSIKIKNKMVGTITDAKGNFSLETTTAPPFTIVVSSVGFENQEVNIEGGLSQLNIEMTEQAILGKELIVSASRVEETILKSPVAIEKLDIRQIRETASPNFYDALANLKGVDLTTQGVLFKSVNMRGFGTTGNPRIVQMIDGMDNQAPGLNFSLDNIIGMPELDVESVEVLPGAASALYGPNAINGLILMNSKSPFLYQGLSANLKSGIMYESNRSQATTPYIDGTIRFAKAFNNKFAFKVNLSYIKAKDWQATNYENLNVGGNPDPNRGPGTDNDYDGVNVYGDEVQTNINSVANTMVANGLLPAGSASLVPNTIVSRTGYRERDLMDYNTKSFKANAAIHYRLNERIEAIGQINFGYGTTAYTATGRYSLRDFNLTQIKFELRGDNFNFRMYTTQERSGKSYLSGLAAVSMLNAIKPHNQWFGEYTGAFVAARSGGMTEADAYLAARKVADAGAPQPGSAEYNALLDKYRTLAIVDGGGAFSDRTNLYHAEGFFNFKNQIKFMELVAGSNYRLYQLRSAGTLFADTKEGRDGTILVNEYGAFLQAGKNIFENHLKLSASLRYDKNQNFDGQFSPRFSAVTTFGSHNIRLSYQTGFRIPTVQNQYIDLKTPAGTLVGGLPEFDTRYNLSSGILRQNLSTANIASVIITDPSVIQSATAYGTAVITQTVTTSVTDKVMEGVAAGVIPDDPAIISAAIKAGVAQVLPATLQEKLPGLVTQLAPGFALAKLPKYQPKPLRPEKVATYEIGYKAVIANKLFIDAYYYMSKYNNFIGGTVIIVPTAPTAPGMPIESGIGVGNYNGYSRNANTTETITTHGFAVGLNYSLPKGFSIGGNVAQNKLADFTPSPEVEYSQFNSPEYRFNISLGRRITSSNMFGFNINYRYQQAFVWETNFVMPTTANVPLFTNTTVPAVSTLDAQVSYKLSSLKSIVKIGGTNLFGKSYIQAYGSPMIGSTYYISIMFDGLMN